MTEHGYYHNPTIHGDTVVFVCEDDLWSVDASGGVARRLTSNVGRASLPALSRDGRFLAFTGRDEGHPEVYCQKAQGGSPTRLTFLGADSRVVGWEPDDEHITFATTAGEPSARIFHLEAINRSGGSPYKLPTGPAVNISYGEGAIRVLGRHTTDLARWKRYRGGLTGDLWIDLESTGDWHRLIALEGNVANPLVLGDRVYFVSDHEGTGNLYSCTPSGEDLQRHTSHHDYYVRHPATDGQRIVYHAGADLYLYDPTAAASRRLEVQFFSSRTQRARKFVPAKQHLEGYDLHPQGHSIAITSRGRPFSLALWEGAVVQHGERDGIRYRMARWLPDGERLVVVSDAPGEERIELHQASGEGEPELLDDLDIGRVYQLAAAPKGDLVAISNHRNELLIANLGEKSVEVVDSSRHDRMRGMAWSADGQWLAYGFADTRQTSIIKLWQAETGDTHEVTDSVLRDVRPAFDPDGKYLYFLSYREFDPVYDNLHFDLGFPWGMRPHLVTLRADLPSPFIPVPRAPGEKDDPDSDREPDGKSGTDSEAKEPVEQPQPLQIDLEGIKDRVVSFPVTNGRYGQIRGMSGKVLYTVFPAEGAKGTSWVPGGTPPAKGRLRVYDFAKQDSEQLASHVTSFSLSADAKSLVYRSGNALRALKAGEKPKSSRSSASRESGWLDLDRIRISVSPPAEWRQMYREAWRLQRDRFWTEDMAGVDWDAVYAKYEPLLDRVATRSEVSDLLWEMQGELGTSHAYEMGGDYRPEPEYLQGFLGADFRYDEAAEGYEVVHVIKGDVWDKPNGSPLARPGVRVVPGDVLVAVRGQPLSRDVPPGMLLVNQASQDVQLTFVGRETGERRTVTVETLRSEYGLRYRDWVDGNRRHVHEATNGRVGYVHIPDMGPNGYAEFHRGFLAEVDRHGLIVDVRFNGGGHVSQLILEKLARRRVGYDIQRWGEPEPYPYESPLGPLVAIANESAGSDGDMFTYAFKHLGLGPVVGKRTWGGVVGINPQDPLVDGSVTTQPEYSFWFEGIGYGLENYGAEPDIEVDIRPQDYVDGVDPQLETAIRTIEKLLADDPPRIPDFGPRPNRKVPPLP